MTINQEKMKEFTEIFDKEIFPTIKGEDGEGVNRLKKIVENKREEVRKRKQKRTEQ